MSGEKLVPLGALRCKCTFFSSEWLDADQVRVAEVAPNEFVVKCGRVLTDREIMGAIVKYRISQGDSPMHAVERTMKLDDDFEQRQLVAGPLDEHDPEDEDSDFIDEDELAERLEDEDDDDNLDDLDDDEDEDTFEEDLEQEFVDRDEEDEPEEEDYEEGLLGEDDD